MITVIGIDGELVMQSSYFLSFFKFLNFPYTHVIFKYFIVFFLSFILNIV